MRKIISLGGVLAIILLLGVGCSSTKPVEDYSFANEQAEDKMGQKEQVVEKSVQKQAKPSSVQQPKPKTLSPQISIGIKFDKDTYEMGEVVENGNYDIIYPGERFTALAITSFVREGYTEKHYATSKGSIKGNQTNGVLSPFYQGKDGYNMLGDSFKEAGVYIYEVYIYDCDTVGKEMKKDCAGITLDDAPYVIQNVDYLSYDKASVTVSEVKKEVEPDPIPESEVSVESGTKDCGTDVACFNVLAEGCQLAKVNTTLSIVAMEAIDLNYNYTIENKGESNGKCELSVLVNSASGKYTDEYRENTLADGVMTADQLDEYEVVAQAQYGAFAGVVSTCHLVGSDTAGFVTALSSADVFGAAELFQKGGCDKEIFSL